MIRKKASFRSQILSPLRNKPANTQAGLFVFQRVKRTSALLLLAFLVATSSTILQPINTYAAGTHPADTARSKALYNALRACVKYEAINQVGGIVAGTLVTDLRANNWWYGPGHLNATFRNPSYLADVFDDGRQTCNAILAEGLSEWGFSDGLDLLCAANIERTNNGGSCKNGTGERINIGSGIEPAIAKAIRDKAFGGEDISGYTIAEHYAIYQAAFIKGCKAVPEPTGSGDRDYTDISVVGADGTITKTRFEAKPKGDRVNVYTRTDIESIENTCGEIAQSMNDYAQGYSTWVKANPEVATPEISPIDVPKDDEPSSCSIGDGIGWVVCPIARAASGFMGFMFGILQGFLNIPSILIDTNAPLFKAWELMRNIANVIFVGLFLLIIYSQMAGGGKR